MKYILSAVAVLCGALLLIDPARISAAVGAAVSTCLEVIVPSLFAFTVLAVYLQSSGLYRLALLPLTKPLSKLMRLDEELCAVFILANIGGYPVGARLLTTLVDESRLTKKKAGRLLCCCYASGPSFIVSVVGLHVFGSAAVGMVLFAAGFAASLLIGVFVCRFGERITVVQRKTKYDLSAECFIRSVMSAARVMLTVCVMIVAFSAVTELLSLIGAQTAAEHFFSAVGLKQNSGAVFSAVLEISRASALSPEGMAVLPLCSALLSFGGVCVILQVAAMTSGKLPLKGFVLSRIPAAAMSALFSLIGLMLPQPDVSVSADAMIKAQGFSVNAGMSLCVLIMCILLLSMDKRGRLDKMVE